MPHVGGRTRQNWQIFGGRTRIFLGCAIWVFLAGGAIASPDNQLAREIPAMSPVQEDKSMSTTNTAASPGQKTPEQVLSILGKFLNDEQVTVQEVTRQLIGNDIPLHPMTENENISVGGNYSREENKGFWYVSVERRSMKPGAFKDGIVETLYISIDPKKFCITRAGADEVFGVKPHVVIPDFNAVWELKFTREQIQNPGWIVDYEFKDKKVSLTFSFKTCAQAIDISSK